MDTTNLAIKHALYHFHEEDVQSGFADLVIGTTVLLNCILFVTILSEVPNICLKFMFY